MSARHLVLIPSYNGGSLIYRTIEEARSHWAPVWVVIDGSDDGTAEGVQERAKDDPGLRALVLPRNRGKGAALFHGLEAALTEGFTHALAMDGDGQHPAAAIPDFMAASAEAPDAMILAGRPSTSPPPPSGCRAAGSPTGGQTSKRWVPASTTPSSAFASTRSDPSSKS